MKAATSNRISSLSEEEQTTSPVEAKLDPWGLLVSDSLRIEQPSFGDELCRSAETSAGLPSTAPTRSERTVSAQGCNALTT